MVTQPGSLIRNRRAEKYEKFGEYHQGTLGCFVRRENESGLFLLSAAHVIALNGLADPDDIIEYRDGDDWVEFARFVSFARFSPASEQQTMDAAIARVTREDLVSARIKEWNILPAFPNSKPTRGDRVRLFGAVSSRLIDAEIYSTGSWAPVIYSGFSGSSPSRLEFKNQIFYGNRQGGSLESVTSGGDSGALVVDELGFAVGLHIAVTSKENRVDASVCTPIATILEHFKASLVVADIRSAAQVVSVGAEAPTEAAPALDRVVTSPEDMADRIAAASTDLIGESIWWMFKSHQHYINSISWRMSIAGLAIYGRLERTDGKPITVDRVWNNFGDIITRYARDFAVPAELIVATICTESSGHPERVRKEPGFISVEDTPHRISVGLMQTLVSTARQMLGPDVTDQALLGPEISIKAGTAYIDNQRRETDLDPPVVACAYNAGRVYYNDSVNNRWRMRQFPIGTGKHADRFVKWFNDCFAYFEMLAEGRPPVAPERPPVPVTSFYNITRSAPTRERI